MQSIFDSKIRWPIKDHLRDAIDILEAWYDAGRAISALPGECRDERWQWAEAPCVVLRRLALQENMPGAVLGFPSRTGVLALRWLLDQAGLGTTTWNQLTLTQSAFSNLKTAAIRLGATRVLFDPGPWPNVDAVYAKATWAVREFGVAWIAVWEWSVPRGLPLSIAPRPWEWFQHSGLEEHHLVIIEP